MEMDQTDVKSDNNSLSSDEIYYYSQIWNHIRDQTSEAEGLIQESALESINESENLKKLLKNRQVSSILDSILPDTVPNSYMNIIKTLEEDLRFYAVDCYASHTLEIILKCCLKYLQDSGENSKSNISADDTEYVDNFLFKTCKFVFNNIADFIKEIYASHVLRTVIEILTGIEVPRKCESKKNSQVISSLWKSPMVVPKKIKELLPEFIDRLCNLPNLPDIISETCGSAVLQCCIIAISSLSDSKDLQKTLVNSIVNNAFIELPDEEIPTIFTENPSCRLLETMLMVATDKQQKYIYESFYKDKLNQICIHKIGNFAVQRLCDRWRDPELFKEIFLAVSLSIESTLENGCPGVLYSLVKACKRLGLNQSKMINNLRDLFQCAEPTSRRDSFPMLLMRFVKFDDSENLKDSHFNYHGVLVLREMLHFKESKEIVNNFLHMSRDDLVEVACDSKASHVINAFMESETILDEKKEKLICMFQEMEVSLACSKSGSRSLEVLWNFADFKTKVTIAQRLLKVKKKLNGNYFGKIILNKFHIFTFHKPDIWERNINAVNKKRKMQDELLNEFQDSYKKRKH